MRKLIFVMVSFFFLNVILTRATDVYVAQSPAGGSTGADCADARAYTSLSGGDWVAGNTIHLCGTFNMPTGASGVITIGGSGKAGNPITVKFETGANATAPYWGTNGFIIANNRNYIVVDGGTNGTITATANGTNLANQYTPTTGVIFSTVSNSEIKNLTISNIYVHADSPNDEVGTQDTWGIQWVGGSNVRIDGNTVHDAYGCIQYGIPTSTTNSNINIFNNNTYNCNWSINVGGGNNSNVVNGVSIYGNKVHDWGNWDEANNANHHDGIFVFAQGTGSSATGVQVYNNLIYGNILTAMTAHIYMSTNGSGNYVFNNVIYNTSSGYPADGFIFDFETGTHIFNNTIVGPGSTNTGGNGYMQYGTGATLRNNIITTCYMGLGVNSGSSLSSSDYNDLYNFNSVAINSGTWYVTLANWQAGTGFDAHSTAGNPRLNAGSTPPYQLSSTSSAAYQKGANLTSYCSTVPALCADANGNARPSSGAWDMGAYQYSTGNSGIPNPPAGLAAVVVVN
jgi:hypothetical protein